MDANINYRGYIDSHLIKYNYMPVLPVRSISKLSISCKTKMYIMYLAI